MRKKFLLAGVTIVLLAAGATASIAVVWLDKFAKDARPLPLPAPFDLPGTAPGKPQTFLVLGSDQRVGDRKKGLPTRSDTMMLIRLDPDKNATSVLSIPRDLRVDIPKHGRNLVNAAYAIGGPKLAYYTIRRLMQSTGRKVEINHIVNVDFHGFQVAVNKLGCVYADVDRRYFNDNDPPYQSTENYAAIDLQPGYQRLCGADALSYVRFRHLDDDTVRSSRQQAFLSQAKGQFGTGKLLRNRNDLLRIVGDSTQSDLSEASNAELFGLAKLAYESSKNPTRDVKLPTTVESDGSLSVSREGLDQAVEQFLEIQPASRRDPGSPRAPRKRLNTKASTEAGLTAAKTEGEDQVLSLSARMKQLPVYFPAARLAQGGYISDTPVPGERLPRGYVLKDEKKRPHSAYRIVLSAGENGQYYGVQGTTWTEAPILESPTDHVKLGDRVFARYFDGKKLRMIAWRPKTGKTAYWVSNTLSKKLSNGQMMGIARSLQRVGA